MRTDHTLPHLRCSPCVRAALSQGAGEEDQHGAGSCTYLLNSQSVEALAFRVDVVSRRDSALLARCFIEPPTLQVCGSMLACMPGRAGLCSAGRKMLVPGRVLGRPPLASLGLSLPSPLVLFPAPAASHVFLSFLPSFPPRHWRETSLLPWSPLTFATREPSAPASWWSPPCPTPGTTWATCSAPAGCRAATPWTLGECASRGQVGCVQALWVAGAALWW